MKRPLGVIGLVYLSALAVFFRYFSAPLLTVTAVSAALATVASVALKLLKRDSKAAVTAAAVSLSVLAAISSLLIYQNCYVAPITDNYSGREIYIEGYVCEEPAQNGSAMTYTIKTERIDGENRSLKLSCTSTVLSGIEPFDRVEGHLTPAVSGIDYQRSRRIFLYAYDYSGDGIRATGEKHTSLYAYAVKTRLGLKRFFNNALNDNAAALTSAVLLGDKRALSADVRADFMRTGVSYLVVVSGMHLSVFTLVIRLLLRKLRVNAVVSLVIISVFVLGFMALTGFCPSVDRAGIMLLLMYFAGIPMRSVDGINSLGFAALVLTVPNPYSVGDMGMLLSFAACFGILLWADKIASAVSGFLHLTDSRQRGKTLKIRQKVLRPIKRILRVAVAVFSTSLAAELWVIPCTILFFGTISPLTLPISLIAYPLTCAVLLAAMVFALFGSFGVTILPLAALLELLCGMLTGFVHRCGQIPFCRIPASDVYFYVWIAVSAVLVAVGYAIRAKRGYVFGAVTVSVLTLASGAALTALTADHTAVLTLYRFGSGYTAAVRKNGNLSLLSCGGTANRRSEITEMLRRTPVVDYMLLTSGRKCNSAYADEIISDFDVKNILRYSESSDDMQPDDGAFAFGDGTAFTLVLNSDVSVRVFAVGKRVYQYVFSENTSVLIVPPGGMPDALPEAYLSADYVLLEGSAKGFDAVDGTLLTIGKKSDAEGHVVIPNNGEYEIRME